MSPASRGSSSPSGERAIGWVAEAPRGAAGLRNRATLAFGLVTLVLATVMSGTVWLTVRQYLLLQREVETLEQATYNARLLDRLLADDAVPVPDALTRLSRIEESVSLVRFRGVWSGTSSTVGPEVLPPALRETVRGGTAAQQRVEGPGGALRLAVGVPLPGGDGTYFEVFELGALDRTLRVLGIALASAVLLTPALGMLLGRWAIRPALRPLATLSAAAAAVAAGDLGARIDPGGDPDLAELSTSFNRTADALERRVQADARFATDVSHELRNPLTTISATAGLLEVHRDRLPDGGAEALDVLRAEVARFERLVADLLEISRADAGADDLAVEAVDPAELVRHGLGPGRRDRLHVDPDAAGVRVRTDKRRLHQVLVNLVDNAESHGRGLRAVTVRRAADRVWILVDDRGPGIPPDLRERVFERFARGPAARTGSGSGLGLALVERHVRLLGGTVEVCDGPDGGARFAVGLPLGGPS
jgi:two-component system, OmpR family, sensor histidine kinase MtrB